ncbi:hypothetical protein RhiirA5_372451 [Rhizophagus irregularis]|uniref:Uncharacterized protein n=1 Tax=Rhizophagus irregularis TaxID=588596 RepID=A0A2I1EDK0_9GLOM|nr:hypothetical protein RhiirA5_372451 [Rhizophagus irregularis]PKY20177.1 hypothetical protein RhiirB3_384676 [Rhizophagus irregularis]
MVAALDYMSDGNYEWGDEDDGLIDDGISVSHHSFELTIPDDVKTFNLVFGVAHSLKVDKWRGPFDNTQDICWHYHGHLNSWKFNPDQSVHGPKHYLYENNVSPHKQKDDLQFKFVLTNIILGENNILLVSVRGYAVICEFHVISQNISTNDLFDLSFSSVDRYPFVFVDDPDYFTRLK